MKKGKSFVYDFFTIKSIRDKEWGSSWPYHRKDDRDEIYVWSIDEDDIKSTDMPGFLFMMFMDHLPSIGEKIIKNNISYKIVDVIYDITYEGIIKYNIEVTKNVDNSIQGL